MATRQDLAEQLLRRVAWARGQIQSEKPQTTDDMGTSS
jgi:hypothetical protein